MTRGLCAGPEQRPCRPSGHMPAQAAQPGGRPQGRGLPGHCGCLGLNTTRTGVDPVPGPASQAARAIPGAPEWRAPHRGPSGMPAPSCGLHTESRRRHPARTSGAAVPPNPIAACAPSPTPLSQPGPGSPPPAPAPPPLEGALRLAPQAPRPAAFGAKPTSLSAYLCLPFLPPQLGGCVSPPCYVPGG